MSTSIEPLPINVDKAWWGWVLKFNEYGSNQLFVQVRIVDEANNTTKSNDDHEQPITYTCVHASLHHHEGNSGASPIPFLFENLGVFKLLHTHHHIFKTPISY